jgi:hypothetical protein
MSSMAEIRSEARGPHWIAWVADSAGKPVGSIVIVGQTREEAEANAREWARRTGS